jgi:hypothetical protein
LFRFSALDGPSTVTSGILNTPPSVAKYTVLFVVPSNRGSATIMW